MIVAGIDQALGTAVVNAKARSWGYLWGHITYSCKKTSSIAPFRPVIRGKGIRRWLQVIENGHGCPSVPLARAVRRSPANYSLAVWRVPANIDRTRDERERTL